MIESGRYWDTEFAVLGALAASGFRAEDKVRFLHGRRPQPDEARNAKVRHFRNRPSVFIYAVPTV